MEKERSFGHGCTRSVTRWDDGTLVFVSPMPTAAVQSLLSKLVFLSNKIRIRGYLASRRVTNHVTMNKATPVLYAIQKPRYQNGASPMAKNIARNDTWIRRRSFTVDSNITNIMPTVPRPKYSQNPNGSLL